MGLIWLPCAVMSGQEVEGNAFWTPLIARCCADHLQATHCMCEGPTAHSSKCPAHSKDCTKSNCVVSLTCTLVVPTVGQGLHLRCTFQPERGCILVGSASYNLQPRQRTSYGAKLCHCERRHAPCKSADMLYLLLGERYCFMRISFLLQRRVSSRDAGFSFLESCTRHNPSSVSLPPAVPRITYTVAAAHGWCP